MTTYSSTLAWKIPWAEEPGGLQSMWSLRVRHNWVTLLSLSCIGEGNGNPLQCSCLENPRDGGAWWATIYGVAQSRTRLKWLSSSSIIKLEQMRYCFLWMNRESGLWTGQVKHGSCWRDMVGYHLRSTILDATYSMGIFHLNLEHFSQFHAIMEQLTALPFCCKAYYSSFRMLGAELIQKKMNKIKNFSHHYLEYWVWNTNLNTKKIQNNYIKHLGTKNILILRSL